MAVNSIYAPAKQLGNGSQTVFGFAFKILAAADLIVYKFDASGVQSAALVLNVDYTVTFDPVAELGTVTYTAAPVNGGYSYITRSMARTQGTVYPRESALPAKTTETALDRLTMMLQELAAAGSTVPAAVEQSGLYANRPVSPTQAMSYYSTDRGSYERWVPAANRWFLIGAFLLGLMFGGTKKAAAGQYYDLQQSASSATMKVVGLVQLSTGTTPGTTASILLDGVGQKVNIAGTVNISSPAAPGGVPNIILNGQTGFISANGIGVAYSSNSYLTQFGGVISVSSSAVALSSPTIQFNGITGSVSLSTGPGGAASVTISGSSSSFQISTWTAAGALKGINFNIDSNGIVSSTSQPVLRWTNSQNQSLVNITDTEVTFDQKAYDSQAMFAVSAATVPAAGAGVYDIRCVLSFDPNTTGVRLGYLKLNGAALNSTRYYAPSAGGSQNTSVISEARLLLNVGDAIKCFAYQNSGGNLNVSAGFAAFEMVKLW